MATHDWKVRIATLLLSLGCVGVVEAAERDPVPTILVDPADPVATPDPVCSVCAIIMRSDEDDSTAVILLTHDYDFVGDVELVVWLDSDERVTVWIPSVTIGGGEEVELELEAGEGWGWGDVQLAWTRLHRTP